MARIILAALGLLAVAACNATPPNDVSEGVGFRDYQTYQDQQAARRAQLRGEIPPQTIRPPQGQMASSTRVAGPAPATAARPAGSTSPAGTDSLTARAAAAIDAAEGQAAAPAARGTGPAPAATNNPGISDEQDFTAVSARETIESDAERRERMQEQMVIVQPTAVPDRPTGIGPNIIDYALSTSHPVGQQIYRRSPFRASRHEANCLAYRSDDLAQEAFLANGGPERDRQALDPDGDGYACGWDPSVYRNAARAARGG